MDQCLTRWNKRNLREEEKKSKHKLMRWEMGAVYKITVDLKCAARMYSSNIFYWCVMKIKERVSQTSAQILIEIGLGR